jgi:hypothetical protein
LGCQIFSCLFKKPAISWWQNDAETNSFYMKNTNTEIDDFSNKRWRAIKSNFLRQIFRSKLATSCGVSYNLLCLKEFFCASQFNCLRSNSWVFKQISFSIINFDEELLGNLIYAHLDEPWLTFQIKKIYIGRWVFLRGPVIFVHFVNLNM